ncbi:SCO6880 family protein [Nocardia terpenica]|uniref:PrgI family protein n=1 Tax=Nocardia terpenica TaxID=455432 RepID=A0A6G9ZF75_9NOCA|nr:SCO6880 family protein [Nocardia terpenica]QIS23643.1 hypothetical protein F6W96_40620 [Nocardia terpenica]
MVDQAQSQPRRTYSAGHAVRRVYAFGLPKRVIFTVFPSILLGVVITLVGFVWVGIGWAVASIVAVVPLTVRFAGKTGYELLLLEWAWQRQRRSGRHILRAGPLSQAPGGRTRVPGVAAGTEMWWGTDKLGRRFGMIRTHSTGQYTAVLRCTPRGTAGMDMRLVDQMVAEWGQFLATVGEPGDLAAIVTVAETIPETGARLRTEMARIEHPQAPQEVRIWLAQAGAGEVADRTGFQLHMRMGVTWYARTEAKRRDPMVMVAELAERLPQMCAALARSQVVAEPMSDHQIAATVRRCYDAREEVEAAVEELMRHRGAPPAGETVDWLDAGPLAADEPDRGVYAHEGNYSRTWVMNAGPAGFHDETVLRPLLQGRTDIRRKRIALIQRPLPPGEASESVHADLLSSSAQVSTARGLASSRGLLKLAESKQARDEEARGAGVVDSSLLVTATADSLAELQSYFDITRDLGTAARRLRLRPAWKQQSAAFAAALGIGVLLPDHATVSPALKGDE